MSRFFDNSFAGMEFNASTQYTLDRIFGANHLRELLSGGINLCVSQKSILQEKCKSNF